MTEEFFDSLKDQGMTMEDYLEATDLTVDQIQADIAREAALRVRDELALEALFREAGLEYTEEELEHEIEQIAAVDKVPLAAMRERLVHSGVIGILRERLMHRHATRYLMEHVKVIEVDPAAPVATEKPKPKKKAAAKKSSTKADDSAKEE